MTNHQLTENLEEAINEAARDLPEGWTIGLMVENGAAWIELYDPDDCGIDVDTADLSLSEMVKKALALAADAQRR
jgi:hypothetical protein